MATLNENLLGTQGQSRAFSRFGPQFQGQNDEIIKNLLTRLGGQAQQGFEPIENQARQDFQQKTIPTIAERFTSLGNGALSSPVHQAQQYGAGAQFETGLAALKSQYGMDQNNQLMQLLQLLAPEQAYFQGQPGLLEGGAKGLAEGLPAYLAAQKMGGQQNQQQDQSENSGGTDWQSGLDTTGNVLGAAAPLAAFIPGIGPIISALLGLGAAGFKVGSKYASNGQTKSFDAQSSPIQQQLMKLGEPSGQANSYNSQYNNLSFKGPGGQSNPLGTIDFSQKLPGLNKIGAPA